MTARSWLGHAPPKTQSRTYTFTGTWLTGETITFTIDNIDLVITLGTTVTTAGVALACKESWNNTTLTDTTASAVPAITGSGATTGGGLAIAQMAELAATVNSNVLTLTVSTAGRPSGTITVATNSASGVITSGTLNAATSANHADNADNWNTNGVPANNDDLTWSIDAEDTQFGLDIGCQPLTITTYKSFTGDIGLPQQNGFSSTRKYAENRTKSLTLTNNSVVTTFKLGLGDGQGSRLQRFDSAGAQSIWNIYGSGRSNDNVLPILLVGTHASNVLNNFNGEAAVGYYNEASTVATVRHGNGASTQAKTWLGPNVTLTSATIIVNGGTLNTNSALSTTAGSVLILAGTLNHYAGNVKALTINGPGKFVLKAGADLTLTNLTINSGGTLDLSNYRNTLTISGTISVYDGAVINDPNGCLKVATASIHAIGCKLADLKLDLGTDLTIALS